MKINTYEGKTEEEAIAKAKEELGGEPVILNVKEVSAPGLFGFFKKHTYRVTAAIEDDSSERTVLPPSAGEKPATVKKEENHRFSAVANEDTLASARSPKKEDPILNAKDDLRSAFKEVGEVISQAQVSPLPAASTYDKNATIIKYNDPVQVTEYRREGGVNQATGRMPNMSQTSRMPDLSGTGRMPNLSGTGRMPNLSGTGRLPDAAAVDRVQDITVEEKRPAVGTHYGVIKMLYNTLLDNEVDERYVNDILNDIDNVMMPQTNIETLMSSVYQKMVLKLGRPKPIVIGANRPKVVFFVGPTGVGKTTTLAKIAARFKLNEDKNIAFLTADTYRIKAVDQLHEYADIMLNSPFEVIKSDTNLNEVIRKYRNNDLILVDTFGFSHQNEEQKSAIRRILEQVDDKYDTSIYLVLSATTKYQDLKAIVDSYKEFTDFDLIFTKLDETTTYGNIYNIRQYADKSLSYVADGQDVVKNLAVLDTQNLVKQLLGGQ